MALDDWMKPEDAKLRVDQVDRAMAQTYAWAAKKHAERALSEERWADWQLTQRQWDAFASDVKSRSNWELFGFGDVEPTCKGFEEKMDAMRASIGLPATAKPHPATDEWKKFAYAAMALTAIIIIVPKLPGWGDLFGKEGLLGKRSKTRALAANRRLPRRRR